MSVVHIEIEDVDMADVRRIASQQQVPVEQVLKQAVKNLVESENGVEMLRVRAERGRNVDINDVLSRVPPRSPDAGDELPPE
jgi:hypothetical protein